MLLFNYFFTKITPCCKSVAFCLYLSSKEINMIKDFFKHFKVKTSFISKKDKEIKELEIFGRDTENYSNIFPLEELNKLNQETDIKKLELLNEYYIRKESFFEDQHKAFIDKVNCFFQLYLFSWGYIGALIIFLLTGSHDSSFQYFKTTPSILVLAIILFLHFIFSLQLIMASKFDSGYETDLTNYIFRNINKSEFDYLKKTIQDKAYAYNCNNLLLENIKKTLTNHHIKLIVVLFSISIYAIALVYFN